MSRISEASFLDAPPWCSTPYGIKGMSSWGLFLPHRRQLSAQRLTASKVCPAQNSRQPRLNGSVLNALRHQRYVQITGAQGRSEVQEVLNALRHQRYVQSSLPPPQTLCFPVLNALRHQRYVQQQIFPVCIMLNKCSTPYGIKGMSS